MFVVHGNLESSQIQTLVNFGDGSQIPMAQQIHSLLISCAIFLKENMERTVRAHCLLLIPHFQLFFFKKIKIMGVDVSRQEAILLYAHMTDCFLSTDSQSSPQKKTKKEREGIHACSLVCDTIYSGKKKKKKQKTERILTSNKMSKKLI